MGEKFLFCIPLECGVKTYAILTVLGTIYAWAYAMTDDLYNTAFWPMITFYSFMALMWCITLMDTTEVSRKAAFYVYLFAVLIASNICYGYALGSGKATDWYCSAENIE